MKNPDPRAIAARYTYSVCTAGSVKQDLAHGAVDDTDDCGFAVHRQAFALRHCVHDESRLHREQRSGKEKSAYRKKKQSAHEKGSLGKMNVSFQTVKALKKFTGGLEWLLKEFSAKVNEKREAKPAFKRHVAAYRN